MFLQKTINAIVEFFQSDKGLDLEQITSATLMKLEEIKERTATGEISSVVSLHQLNLKLGHCNGSVVFGLGFISLLKLGGVLWLSQSCITCCAARE